MTISSCRSPGMEYRIRTRHLAILSIVSPYRPRDSQLQCSPGVMIRQRHSYVESQGVTKFQPRLAILPHECRQAQAKLEPHLRCRLAQRPAKRHLSTHMSLTQHHPILRASAFTTILSTPATPVQSIHKHGNPLLLLRRPLSRYIPPNHHSLIIKPQHAPTTPIVRH